MESVIPFGELAPNASVRFTKINDKYHMSIRDLVMVYCEVDNNYAAQIWRRLPDERKKEVQSYCGIWKFAGPREKTQDVITFEGAMKLIMWLPGNSAKDFRSKVTDILTRYLAGDHTLVNEIEKNAESNHPVNVMARAAMEDSESSEDEMVKKRKIARAEALEDMKIQEMALSLQERASALKERANALETERRVKDLDFFKTSMELVKSLHNGKIDARTALQYEDHIKNLTFYSGGPVLAVTNGDASSSQTSQLTHSSQGINISLVALGMKYNITPDQAKDIGKKLAKKYREKYGENPPKHDQQQGGMIMPVNSYTEKDRDMMEEAIRDYMTSQESSSKDSKVKYSQRKIPFSL